MISQLAFKYDNSYDKHKCFKNSHLILLKHRKPLSNTTVIIIAIQQYH